MQVHLYHNRYLTEAEILFVKCMETKEAERKRLDDDRRMERLSMAQFYRESSALPVVSR